MRSLIKNNIGVQDIVKYLLLLALLGTVFWYVNFQARNLIDGPKIILTDTLSVTQAERTVEISGLTKNITALTLNGKTIHTDKEGYFQESLVLESGYTIMTLSAEDRYGRTTSVSKSFVYAPST